MKALQKGAQSKPHPWRNTDEIHGARNRKHAWEKKGNNSSMSNLDNCHGRKGYCFSTMTSVCNKMIPIPPVQCQRASPSKAHRGPFEVARMREWVTCATCWSRNPDLQRRRRWCWSPPGAVILLPCPTYNHSGEAQVGFPTLAPKRMPLRFGAIIHRRILSFSSLWYSNLPNADDLRIDWK